MIRALARSVGILAGMSIAVGVPVCAQADTKDRTINNLPSITDEMVSRAIVDLKPIVVDLLPVVEELESESTDGAEKVLTLNSDILFTFDKATITPTATTKIGELVKALPQKAKVSVGGHTDSLGTDARNLALSQGASPGGRRSHQGCSSRPGPHRQGLRQGPTCCANGTPDEGRPGGPGQEPKGRDPLRRLTGIRRRLRDWSSTSQVTASRGSTRRRPGTWSKSRSHDTISENPAKRAVAA